MSTYLIDPSHSKANFSIKHMMIAKVHGGFEKISGKFIYDPKNPEASFIEATIETNTINTREPQRDAHLIGAEFFNAEKFPTITFFSKRVMSKGGTLKIVGDLTIHGVTNSVILDAVAPSKESKDPKGIVTITVAATTKIKRKDFGLTWSAAIEAGGLLVGDDVAITLNIQFIKQG